MLRGNVVSIAMPAGATDLDALMEISRPSHTAFRVKVLSETLKAERYIRGRAFFGHVGDVIAKILLGYPYLRWWIEVEGLVVEEMRSELGPLSEFDRIAGALVIEHSRDGKLSVEALELIAARLDEKGFQLNGNLQKAQWKPISEYNQKHARTPIKSFASAVKRDQFVHNVRRRLYVARDRYKKAIRPAEPKQYVTETKYNDFYYVLFGFSRDG